MESWQSIIRGVLDTLQEETYTKLITHLKDIGVRTVSDLQFISIEDIKDVIPLIAARKLLHFIKNEDMEETNAEATFDETATGQRHTVSTLNETPDVEERNAEATSDETATGQREGEHKLNRTNIQADRNLPECTEVTLGTISPGTISLQLSEQTEGLMKKSEHTAGETGSKALECDHASVKAHEVPPSLLLSDTGTTTRAHEVPPSLPLSDTGTTTRAHEVPPSLLLSDTGATTRAPELPPSLLLSDTGATTRAHELPPSLPLSDTGFATLKEYMDSNVQADQDEEMRYSSQVQSTPVTEFTGAISGVIRLQVTEDSGRGTQHENEDLAGQINPKAPRSEDASRRGHEVSNPPTSSGTNQHSDANISTHLSTDQIRSEVEEVCCGVPSTDITNLFIRLDLDFRERLTTSDVLKITSYSMLHQESSTEKELANLFLQKLLTTNYSTRYTSLREETMLDSSIVFQEKDEKSDVSDVHAAIFKNKNTARASKPAQIHPMDIQMAVFHCADQFLKQLIVTKLSQCQYALPLLVPNPFTKEVKFPLWTFQQIKKSWKMRSSQGEVTSKSQSVFRLETPMVAFLRLGSVSSSKSQLMNSLINEKHNTFFHRNCPGSSRTRLLMEGVVEIAWYCPSGRRDDKFKDCVAFCNLHGDAGANRVQRRIVTSMATINVVLLPDLDENDRNMATVEALFRLPTPLICIRTEDEDPITEIGKGRYYLGLKNRNQADVSAELIDIIRLNLSKQSCQSLYFSVENVSSWEGIKLDTESEECRKGHDAALQIMQLLIGQDPSSVKETFLPCQGKLWHDWSQMNKELHRLRGENIEADGSQRREGMRNIRQMQRAKGLSHLMKPFVENFNSLSATEKQYFLRWVGILLDDFTSEKLCTLYQEYDTKWGTILALKKTHDRSEQLEIEQQKLEKVSLRLNEATFGLEHIFREMGQVYESNCVVGKAEVRDKNVLDLPKMAAELMISGHPIELMDGDAAHVPLVWITAVLDELIKLLGDRRVFVLSVLGIQSSGKSTMLNAMFGLQFAVSAGRCTRGAFMQLVKVSEEMKADLNCDFILVVDTEGLRALELAGKATVHHDNELATFVVGLGNMTLINIFGENPCEMQDILQIVVQAFLRMKKVRLNPSCMFVHQNVTDITAGEKNQDGRRRLQEKLDEMTKLAAEEEVCDAECFSDVIAFDIQKDVQYFAQLWEGSPPMAPPNPRYGENIQELKETILFHVSKSDGMMMSGLKTRVQDLWEALLSENFVFSFKNALEISTYRKLETEYGRWTWKIRSTMLEIGNRLYNQIESGELHQVEECNLQTQLQDTSKAVAKSMAEFFERDKDRDILIQWRGSFEIKIKELQKSMVNETKRKLWELLKRREVQKMIDDQKTQHEKILFERSRDLALELKSRVHDEETLKKEFDSVWRRWVYEIKIKTPSVEKIDISKDVMRILGEVHNGIPLGQRGYKNILTLPHYTNYVIFKKSVKQSGPIMGLLKDLSDKVKHAVGYEKRLTPEEEHQIKQLVNDIAIQTDNMIKSKPIAKMGYNISYIQELTDHINSRVKEYEGKQVRFLFKKEFTLDLSICVCETAKEIFTQLHQRFIEANDPVFYVQSKQGEFYRIFQKYCQDAASAKILGEIICQKLKEPIRQSVYKETAIKVADELRNSHNSLSGNRANQEKHILKSLANKADFGAYLMYIHLYKKYVKVYVKDEVSRYITERFEDVILRLMNEQIDLKLQSITKAAKNATHKIKEITGGIHGWLLYFKHSLSGQLVFTEQDVRGVSLDDIDNFDLLEEVVTNEIPKITSDVKRTFSTHTFPVMLDDSDRPDEILMKHFEQYCWEQCPFCGATCTNTVGGHDEDHMVPIHRNCGMSGMSYRNTTNLSISFCTSAVASDRHFYTSDCPDESIPWKNYRTAGELYEHWSITPDLSELQYWKWFVCHFQENLERYYENTFEGRGEIPEEWRNYTKDDAIDSLDHYF